MGASVKLYNLLMRRMHQGERNVLSKLYFLPFRAKVMHEMTLGDTQRLERESWVGHRPEDKGVGARIRKKEKEKEEGNPIQKGWALLFGREEGSLSLVIVPYATSSERRRRKEKEDPILGIACSMKEEAEEEKGSKAGVTKGGHSGQPRETKQSAQLRQ